MGITNNWDEKTFYLEDVTGEFYIAFHAKDIVGNEPKSLNIDFIRIDEIPSCPEPYEVFVEDITEDSLELSWEQYGDSNSWEVVLLPAGTEFPTDETDLNVIEVNGTPSIVIQDLNAGMLYDIYVRTKCDDEYSVWTDPVKGGTKAINDLCIDSISIPVNQGIDCDEYVSGTLFGASLSDFTDVSCLWDDPESDVWFDFVATSTTLDLTLKSLFNYLVPSPIVQVVVYKGEMCGDLTETVCQESAYDGDTYIRLEDLVVGDRYYIRVLETMDANVFFDICLTSINPPIHVSESDDVYTVEELVKDIFVKSSCDLVSNISWKSGLEYGSNSIGYFEKVDSDFGFEYGIVLATNAIQDVPGPVLEEYEQLPDPIDWSGDSDLDDLLIANGNLDSTYNASVLEFDFIPVDENIKFDFIFASNEYGVYQCEYSDIFAFLLTDLESGITTNLAVVPGTTTPISTTTIRKEIFSPTDPLNGQILCGDANPEYFDVFYDNEIGVLQKNSPISYAGMTIPMVAEAIVIPGKKYHIKLAIQDYKDPNRNSAVFLRGGSFDLGIVDLGGDMLVSENSALCEGGIIVLDTKLEDGEKLEISWLKDGVVIPGEVGLTLEVNEAGVYTFEGKYKEVPSCVLTDSVTVEFYTPLEDLLKAPRDLEFCSNSSSETIDLTQVERDMFIEGIDALEFSFEYYTSLEDRDERENLIENPTLYSLSTIENSTFYLLVTNNTTDCEGYFEFQIKKIAITAPKNPGNQQQCMVYVFPELPENEFYYSEPNAGGIEFLPGDEIDIPGVYEVYIHKTLDNCSAETKFSIIVSQAQEPLEIEDVILQCENYILPELPIGSEYYSEANEGGVRIAAGTEILFNQTIYVVTKSLEGPNYCVAESSFNVSYKECPIPRGISPNGDGFNDYLDLSTYGVTSLVIYNRYGLEVYSYGLGYTNQWKGQDKNGNSLPDGTYYYSIVSHGKVKTGWIQINR